MIGLFSPMFPTPHCTHNFERITFKEDYRRENWRLQNIWVKAKAWCSTPIISAVSRLGPTTRLISYCKDTYSTSTSGKFFTKKHEWVSIKDNIGTIGISKYAQEALGEVVYCQLPDVGSEVVAGQECAALESVKAASEVYTPVSGTVTEKNTNVESSPSIINTSCYDGGWLFRIKISRPEDLDLLMTHAAYEEFLLHQEDH